MPSSLSIFLFIVLFVALVILLLEKFKMINLFWWWGYWIFPVERQEALDTLRSIEREERKTYLEYMRALSLWEKEEMAKRMKETKRADEEVMKKLSNLHLDEEFSEAYHEIMEVYKRKISSIWEQLEEEGRGRLEKCLEDAREKAEQSRRRVRAHLEN